MNVGFCPHRVIVALFLFLLSHFPFPSSSLLLGGKVVTAAEFALPSEWRFGASWSGCIDHHSAIEILMARSATQNVVAEGSISLGLTRQHLLLNQEGVCLFVDEEISSGGGNGNGNGKVKGKGKGKAVDNGGEVDGGGGKLLATWDELTEIATRKQGCYALYDDGSKPWRISTLSKTSGIPASLCPPLTSSGAPTMVLGGFTMHRIAGTDMNPTKDTAAKISALPNLYPGSVVLDTCCGLGYTAQGAARKVMDGGTGRVVVFEYDIASIEMCAYNPHSQGLFDGTLPISLIHGDACSGLEKFEKNTFNAIIHDPPARALCRKDLYGLQFYKELRRVLKPSGTLFHYIGSPDSKESGKLYKGIASRLTEAGFTNIVKVEAAYGLKATAAVQSMRIRQDYVDDEY